MIDSANYCQTVGEQHRRRFGQYFTHPKVAEFMLNWVTRPGAKELYDPAFGLGIFRPKQREITFSASEFDPLVFNYCQAKSPDWMSGVVLEDYLATWGKKHSNIVCNPPYMRFQKFLNRDKVFQDFRKHLNIELSGYTNTASAFLLKSLSELSGTGRLCYLMPLEFLNAGYGTLVKRKLIESNHLCGIINLECERDIFPEVITSVGILLYDAASTVKKVSFYNLTDIEELDRLESLTPASEISVSELDASAKWLPHFQREKVSINSSQMVGLDYYGRFSRGIATGANEFFVLSKSKVNNLKLSSDDYLQCITRSSQVSRPIFSANDIQSLISADKPVLLFSPNGSQSDGATRYIEHGESLGYHQRFLTKHRNPWYKTELRSPSPLLLGVFSRGGYKVILNSSQAINLTCYHGFKPNLFGTKYLKHLFLYFYSSTGRQIIGLSMRKYGDSLEKFEPNDLNSAFVPAPETFDVIDESDVDEGINEIAIAGALPKKLELKFCKMMVQSPKRVIASMRFITT